MRYMLMMHAPRGDGDWQVNAWTPEELRAHIGFMKTINLELIASGEWVDAQGLAMPAEARVVRAGQDGKPVVTDGPFAESKEFLAGFWILDVPTTERAYEIASRISTAPGKGGTPLHMPVEVRQVMSAPPTEA
ncbi:MAG: YciI family protein [Gemmatimonadota bacterium]